MFGTSSLYYMHRYFKAERIALDKRIRKSGRILIRWPPPPQGKGTITEHHYHTDNSIVQVD
jgi:hypothetical protein